jgi:hypothetical protein
MEKMVQFERVPYIMQTSLIQSFELVREFDEVIVSPGFVQGETEAGARGDQVLLADWCVAQIDSVLHALNITDNTILIFTSDNGPRAGVNGHDSSGPFRGQKGEIWEGGHRIPLPVPGTPGQLYNLEKDSCENCDLWNVMPGKVAELNTLLNQYIQQGHSRPFEAPWTPCAIQL